MKNIDFEQAKNKRKKAFLNDNLSRAVLNEIFPVMVDVNNGDIHVINYVSFRSKRLIDLIIHYKDMYISMALDFMINNDSEISQIKTYKAIYKFNITVDKDKYQDILFDSTEKLKFNPTTFKEFLGADAVKFSLLFDSYYSKKNCPMQFKQTAIRELRENGAIYNDISFDTEFFYQTKETGFFFNIFSNEISTNSKEHRTEVIRYQLKPIGGVISGTFDDFDFWDTLRSDASMIAEPFRFALRNHHGVDEYVIPYFTTHTELFDYYNTEKHRIVEISEMIKI